MNRKSVNEGIITKLMFLLLLPCLHFLLYVYSTKKVDSICIRFCTFASSTTHPAIHLSKVRKVASSRLSRLVAHTRIFRLFMKGKIDAYVLWPLAIRIQNWIVDRSTARNFKVLNSRTRRMVLISSGNIFMITNCVHCLHRQNKHISLVCWRAHRRI